MYDAFAAVDNNSASDGSEGTGDELQSLGQDKLHRPSHTRNLKSHLKESSAVISPVTADSNFVGSPPGWCSLSLALSYYCL